MKYYETEEFVRLQDEYYAKLEDEGFRDIEPRIKGTSIPGPNLSGMSAGDLARGLYRPDAEDYYRWCRQHTHTMARGVDRHVWRLHADGTPKAQIVRALGRRYGLSRGAVEKIIRREEEAMRSRMTEEHDGTPEHTGVVIVLAEAVRPPWYTFPSRGAVTGRGLAARVKRRVR
jgi:hypothetical protein